MIAESQLKTWASQGPTTQFTDTYNRIRDNLLDKGAPYALADTEVFLQGSYKNDTNVYGDSDVDIVLCHTATFFRDLTRLSADDQRAYETASVAGKHAYADFKRDAAVYIARLYNNVNTGKKAVYVPGGNSGRRNADVLIAFQFRRYYEFKSWQNQRFSEGVAFITTGGNLVENFPKLHSDNCTAKHQATGGYFKPVVRIFKNMRNAMIEKGLLAEGVAPSYFIEGMLYNVPDGQFRGTYQETWINCYRHVTTVATNTLFCANRMHWLVLDNSPTSWPVANFNAFTAALRTFWER